MRADFLCPGAVASPLHVSTRARITMLSLLMHTCFWAVMTERYSFRHIQHLILTIPGVPLTNCPPCVPLEALQEISDKRLVHTVFWRRRTSSVAKGPRVRSSDGCSEPISRSNWI